mgnify:CR=1 FL=1
MLYMCKTYKSVYKSFIEYTWNVGSDSPWYVSITLVIIVFCFQMNSRCSRIWVIFLFLSNHLSNMLNTVAVHEHWVSLDHYSWLFLYLILYIILVSYVWFCLSECLFVYFYVLCCIPRQFLKLLLRYNHIKSATPYSLAFTFKLL